VFRAVVAGQSKRGLRTFLDQSRASVDVGSFGQAVRCRDYRWCRDLADRLRLFVAPVCAAGRHPVRDEGDFVAVPPLSFVVPLDSEPLERRPVAHDRGMATGRRHQPFGFQRLVGRLNRGLGAHALPAWSSYGKAERPRSPRRAPTSATAIRGSRSGSTRTSCRVATHGPERPGRPVRGHRSGARRPTDGPGPVRRHGADGPRPSAPSAEPAGNLR
jgi:hypothetical protein